MREYIKSLNSLGFIKSSRLSFHKIKLKRDELKYVIKKACLICGHGCVIGDRVRIEDKPKQCMLDL